MSTDRARGGGLRRAALALGLVLAALAGPARAEDALHDELMRASGLWRQVAQFEPLLQAGLAEAAREAGAGIDWQALGDAAARAFAPERVRAVVRATLAKELSAADARASLDWLHSEIGRRITAIEETAGEVEETRRREEIAAQVLAGLPPERADRLARFARATSVGEYAFRVQLGMAVAIGRGIAAAKGAGTGEVEAVRRGLEAQKAQILPQLERQAVADMAVVYGPVSDRDLDAYIAFAESPAGRRYHAVSTRAIEAALTQGAEALGRALGSKTAVIRAGPALHAGSLPSRPRA